MKKIIALLALSWGGFCMAQQPDSGTEAKPEISHRHLIGIKKDLARAFRVEYAYQLGKRWHLGAGYYYFQSDKAPVVSFNSSGIINNIADSAPGSQVLRFGNSFYAVGMYDIILRDYFVLRGAFALGYGNEKRMITLKDNVSAYGELPDNSLTFYKLSLDALARIAKHYEAGISISHDNLTPGLTKRGNTIPSLFFTFNFRF